MMNNGSLNEGSFDYSHNHNHHIDAFNVDFDGYNALQMEMFKKNLCLKATELNHGCWYNMFGTLLTRKNVQYHWKLRIRKFNDECKIMAGIMDNQCIVKYT